MVLPTNGLTPGQTVTTTGHASDTKSVTAPATPSHASRRPREPGAATKYANASPGSTIHAASIFVRKPSPTKTPAHTSHRALSIARVTQ